MKIECFSRLYTLLQQANIKNFSEYQRCLDTQKCHALALRCCAFLNNKGLIKPNLALDWSVWSAYLSQALGFGETGIWDFRDSYFTADVVWSHSLLIKWAGNNNGSWRNLSGSNTQKWETVWNWDCLYADMLPIFSREIARMIPSLSSKTNIRLYIASYLVEALQKKYRREYANQYWWINVKPDDMTLDQQDLATIQSQILREIKQARKSWKLAQVLTHGEFEWVRSLVFLGNVIQELRDSEISDAVIHWFFRGLSGSGGRLNVSHLLMYGCFPFHFTWCNFQYIESVYVRKRFDFILAKKSESHQDDDAFYGWLTATANILDQGWVYITDGMCQSYSRYIRLDPDKMRSLLTNSTLQVWINMDYSVNPPEIQSLIIQKKDQENPSRDEKISASLLDHLGEGCCLVSLSRSDDDILIAAYDPHLNTLIDEVRQHIGPELFDEYIHGIIDTASRDGNHIGMVVKIITHLILKWIQREPTLDKTRKSITQTIHTILQNGYNAEWHAQTLWGLFHNRISWSRPWRNSSRK